MSIISYSYQATQLPAATLIGQTRNPTNQLIQGVVFLYPLRAEWIKTPKDADLGPDSLSMGDFSELFKAEETDILCLQVWVKSQECKNWESNGQSWLQGRFPSRLPIGYFLGKKEGDVVELSCPTRKKHFSLTCQQLGSRYQENNRTFENIMEEMFMVTYNNLLDTYQKGSLTEEEQVQWQIIDEMKKQYFPHSTETSRGG